MVLWPNGRKVVGIMIEWLYELLYHDRVVVGLTVLWQSDCKTVSYKAEWL